MLTDEQLAELNTMRPAAVRSKLFHAGPGRGASVSGFRCGEITRGDIDDWLTTQDEKQASRDLKTFNYARWTFYVAVGALIAAIVGIIVTVLHV
jgi:hypothetical protein